MAILAAPYLEEKLPAQQGDTLRIPFTLNRAVGESDISQVQLKVKNISTNTVKLLIETSNFHQIQNNQYIAQFVIPKEIQFLIGQFYKAQIAFLNKNEEKNDVGEFSTVGVFKYTKVNSIKILDAITEEELKQFKPNSMNYVGQINFDDITEKVAEYKFDIYDSNDNLFYTTGYLIHNAENNKNNKEALDFFRIKQSLKESETYSIIYSVITVNNLEISSPEYSFIILPEISTSNFFPGKLKIRIDNDDGYFSLFIHFTENKKFSGSFRLLRADSEDNFIEWKEMKQISFSNKETIKDSILELFKDFTIKQGVIYRYALQQFSDTFFAKKMICNIESKNGEDIYNENFRVNFEDILLYDGIRQLKIKFNPKISSFKNTILESKIDTMGNKYPIFFRNGSVSYKEFSISGLISYHMDENNYFFNIPHNDKSSRPKNNSIIIDQKDIYSSTDLSYRNILQERDFKLEVLNWLNNGKEKLFRSPTEGNYIVRLMNISLTPNDTLGRMLHTFSATAYECAEYNFTSLEHFGIVKNEEESYEGILFDTLILRPQGNILPMAIELPSRIDLPRTIFARLINVNPETEINLFFENGNQVSIVVGYTGQYNISIEKNNLLKAIEFPRYINKEAIIEYGYYNSDSKLLIYDKNNNILDNFMITNKVEQFCGPEENIINKIIHNQENKKEQLENLSYVRIQKKLVDEVWIKDNNLYLDNRFKNKVQLLKTSLYYALNNKKNPWYYIDNNFNVINIPQPDIKYYINNDSFILNSGRIELDLNNQKIDTIAIGNGLYADIFYSKSSYEIKKEGQ